MGISRDSIHKKKHTGGRKCIWRKKRKHEAGRQASNTRIGFKQISIIRVRGGNVKNRALYLNSGNFAWISIQKTKKTRILSVVYNLTNRDVIRTNTLVKGVLVYIDASPFKNDFISMKKIKMEENITDLYLKQHKNNIMLMENQITSGKILARICSRPGQHGRSDGYILENAELEFYLKKIQKKK